MRAYLAASSTTTLARDPKDVLGEENAARHTALDKLVLQTGRPAHSFEEEISDQSGQRSVFLTSKSPLTDESATNLRRGDMRNRHN